MIDLNTIINTCYQLTTETRTIAYFSHVIPVILSVFLAVLVLAKAKFNLFSKVFSLFIATFSLWLIGDLITWTSNDYHLIYAVWSFLLYIEIIFFTLGLYFVLIFVRKKDISNFYKIILFLCTLAPFIGTVMQQSVIGFSQSWCEALNNNFLDIYKLIYEAIILLVILFCAFIPFFKKEIWKIKKTSLIMLGAMFLFLSAFGITEYLAATTGNYELNLYSLFLLPVFVFAIIYSVFELDVFNFKMLGTHYLVVGLMVLMIGQLFFIQGTANLLLTILTLIITFGLSILLFRNLKKESDQRVHIEKLSEQLSQSKLRLEDTNTKLEGANEKLKSLDKLKTEFLSLASHQLRSPLTAIKGYTSMLLEGDYGNLSAKPKEAIDRVFQSSKHLTTIVEDLLNVAKIEQGGMQYIMKPFNFEDVASSIAKDLSIVAENKGLKLTFSTDKNGPYSVNGDMEKIRQVVLNFIDNSIKYTKKGNIIVKLEKDKKTNKMTFSVADTGVGIDPVVKDTLFHKFARGDGGKMDATGTGLGLYLAKEIIEGHKGKVWAESEGKDKGSKFFIELDTI
ncbi:MAG: ATP-binding protein [Candidatus Paceibacterota bacterium]|jgi:signal transduction histidine kinase